MIQCAAIRLEPDHSREDLVRTCAAKTGLTPKDILHIRILRRSIEARKKERLSLICSVLLTVRDEAVCRAFLKTAKGKKLQHKHSIRFVDREETYRFPVRFMDLKNADPPVIIGSGPAGLLCAYELAQCGLAPVVIERGMPAEQRVRTVRQFWETGKLDPECNVQFGEGGAGTFSDGKLNTGVTDRECRMKEVLELFVRCGAPEDILYDSHPHVGSDILPEMVRKIRNEIIDAGGRFLFQKKAEDLILDDGHAAGIRLSDGSMLASRHLVFAIGHSARDTFRMLYGHGVRMAPKAFAVGVRCEHDQEMINRNQWGEDYPKSLGAAPYKLTYRAGNGRSVYTFCMCPGGLVVNASSEPGGIAVNGMSNSRRDSGRANSAVIVSVTPEDFRSYESKTVPAELTGAAFQRDLEERAFRAGNGSIPVQLLGDLRKGILSDQKIETEGACCGRTASADLREVLPEYVMEAILEGFDHFGQKICGFSSPDTLLYAVESRTSSPVRIIRDALYQSSVAGLYPCGEGAGYAGGIMSAAIDGIRVAEAVAASYALFLE